MTLGTYIIIVTEYGVFQRTDMWKMATRVKLSAAITSWRLLDDTVNIIHKEGHDVIFKA